jgi:predicted nucleotidyltransferase
MTQDLETILEHLKKLPFCEGIIFSGSRLEGVHSPDSDYDFTVLISKGKSYYKIFKYKKYLVDICCATAEVIKEKDLTNKRVANAELYILTSGQILFDKFGNLGKIQTAAKKIWKNGPAKISKKDLIETGYAFKTYIDDLKGSMAKNIDGFYFQSYVIQNVVKFFFKLYKKWQPRPRDMEQEIQKIDIRFWKLYKEANISINKDRGAKIIKMIEYLVKKFNLPQTGEIYFLKK